MFKTAHQAEPYFIRIALINRIAAVCLKLAKAAMLLILGTAALSFADAAHAREIAYSANAAGGELILTNSRGKCPDGQLIILSRTASGAVLAGCYAPSESMRYLYAFWNDGTSSMYSLAGFALYEDSAPPTNATNWP